MPESGIFIDKAKNSITDPNLRDDLTYIFADIIDEIEVKNLSILKISVLLKFICLNDDKVNLMNYIQHRLGEDDFTDLINNNIDYLQPADVVRLQNCPGTTIAIERAFSMLKSILTDNRHFTEANWENLFIRYYNSK